ncbi:signal peptidase I [Longimycelium tulufanense]|uniref:Signal peptidase I n=1 Tax=Longimycelium tulufanense TaxID=907463 RepID=A0A8J3FUZ7_9PSEU|nr:signal peptidase I [Longimycelium tulufanense]GGM39821.1 signal peptidase I [Longimycelium tulufanense]
MADVVSSQAPQDDPDRPGSAKDGATADGRSGRRWKQQKKKGSFWRELPLLVLIALVLTFLIQSFIARVYVIPSGSMEQTLHGCAGCVNDRVMVDKITYHFRDPEPGDVVVFRGPESWGVNEIGSARSDNPVVRWFQDLGSAFGIGQPDERDFVKRVIAVGGQTVEWDEKAKRVKVDGKLLDEPYVYWIAGTGPEDVRPFGPVKVPAGHLWMMGDNRNGSADSREHMDGSEQGTVPVDNVIGIARFVVLPPQRWQGIDDHNPQAAPVAMNAPAWQQGLPLGAGIAGAFPVWWVGRRLREGMADRRGRHDQG